VEGARLVREELAGRADLNANVNFS